MSFIGNSPPIDKVRASIKIASQSIAPLLIYGETGTGKELVAEEVYNQSNLKGKFVRVNCAAIQDSLLESELFGHVKGAFTGAHIQKTGKLTLANEGLLFLDEITNMSAAIQAKILRAIEYQMFEPVGGLEQIKVNVRIVSATNVNILNEVANAKFRTDLYHRIGVLIIEIPPLRKRIDDIPLLISHFVNQLNKLYQKHISSISPEAMTLLQDYLWPGNVRELKNVVERAVLHTSGTRITEHEICLSPFEEQNQSSILKKLNVKSDKLIQETVTYALQNGYKGKLPLALDDFEYAGLFFALAQTRYQKDAAKILGVSQRNLCYKMAKFKHRLDQDQKQTQEKEKKHGI